MLACLTVACSRRLRVNVLGIWIESHQILEAWPVELETGTSMQSIILEFCTMNSGSLIPTRAMDAGRRMS